MKKKLNVLISSGGTGGHLIPAQQLAKKLIKEDEAEILFMAKGLSDNRNFNKEIYKFKDVSSGPLTPKKIIGSLFAIFLGTVQTIASILKNKVDIIVGFGSYHTFPVLLGGYLLRKPIVVFESNSTLGKVNRFFAKKAKVVAMQFEMNDQKKYKNMKLVPTLPWIAYEEKMEKKAARKKLKLNEDLFTFLVFGGSLGASFINDIFSKACEKIITKGTFQVIHICGDEEKSAQMKSFYESLNIVAHTSPYEKDMIPLYSAADIVICRSGAATISELIFFEKPSILIPFPFSSENHQALNAFFMEEKIGGGTVFLEKNFDFQEFIEVLKEALDPGSKKTMEMKNNLCNFKFLLKNENRQDLNKVICEVVNNL